MARRQRIVYPGSLHHITARGIGRRTLFVDDDDRRAFLHSLALVVRDADWSCHCFCLMGNHFHLLVQTGSRGLTPGMHRLQTRCAQRYNRLYGVTGHVFDRRFANQLVTRGEHLFELVRYIHLNPVRARLCTHPSAWAWSSFRAIAGIDPAPGFLSAEGALGLFGRDEQSARAAFVRFVEDGMTVVDPPHPDTLARPSLAELVRSLGLEGGLLAYLCHGYRQPEIAAALGMSCTNFRRELQRRPGFVPGTDLFSRALADRGPGLEAVTRQGSAAAMAK